MTIRSGTITVSINSVSVIFAAEKNIEIICQSSALVKKKFGKKAHLKDVCCVSFLCEMNTCKTGLKGRNDKKVFSSLIT